MSTKSQNNCATHSNGDLSRREILAYTAVFGSTFLADQGLPVEAAASTQSSTNRSAAKRYDMKKSINLWALPYPAKMPLRRCFQLCKDAGFDGVEVNYALDGDLSPEASESHIRNCGKMARDLGLQISGVCSFLFWPYSLTHEDPERRKKGLDLAVRMVHAARLLETDNLLIVPGATYVPWLADLPPVPHDVCEQRAIGAMRHLIPEAEKADVYLNVENIFTNGFLHSPQEMNRFVDGFGSARVRIHFDTGNIMQYHFPEHWIPLLGRRIKNVHLKEASKKVHEFNLDTFRPLLDGTTNWPAVLEALETVEYRGYLTFEYFNPFPHYPEALVYHTSDALDRMLGRKT
jgi:L-ribulose-5-phosphate 3-epimerase